LIKSSNFGSTSTRPFLLRASIARA
jgi:hypothetical protein